MDYVLKFVTSPM